MIGTYEIRCHAAKPQMPLSPMFAFKDSPSSLRLLEIPKKIGNWNITTVKVAVNYPDNTSTTYTASRNGNVWVVTFNGCSITGKVANGLEILADGTDENGDAVNGYVLGVGDIYILDRDADIEEAVSKHIMKYCDETPETPVAGDVVVETGTLKIYDGTQWISIDIDLSEYATKSEVETTASTLDSKIDSTKTELESSIAEVASDIPTTTSELTNDSDFITSTQVTPANYPVGYAKYAFFSGQLMMKTSSTGFDGKSQVSLLPTENGKGAAVNATLPSCVSWFLSEYNGTTYNPPIELKFGYCDSVYTIITIGGSDRKTVTNVKSFAWFAQGEREGYVIKIVPSGNTFLPDAKLRIGRLEHPVTYNTAKTSIETIDGQSEMIVCTRANTITTYTDYELAYKDELPTKVSDLTNDAGYLTTVSWNDVQGKPTNVSDFTNDAGYVNQQTLNTALSGKVSKSGDTVQWIGIGRTEQRIQANEQLGFEFSIDEFGSAKVVPPRGVDVTLNFPSTNGTLATTDYVTSQIPTKTSDLVNDSGFITASAIPSQISAFENNVGYITASVIPSNISSFNNDAGYLTAGSQTIQDITASVSSIGSNVTTIDASVISLGTSVSALAVSMSGKRNYPDLTYVIPSHPSEDNYPELKKWDKAAISKFVLTITGYGAESWDLNHFTTSPTEGLKWVGTPWTIYTSDGWYFYLKDSDEHQASAFRLEQFLSGDVTFSIGIGGQAYSAKLHMEQNEYCNIALDYQTSTGKLHVKRNGVDVGTYDPTVIEGTNINIVVPTNISQLDNDSGFVTATTVASNYYNKTQIDGMIGSINTVLDNINGEVI